MMKLVRNILTTVTVLASLTSANTFEQNGVKEGNNKISIGLYTTVPDVGDTSMTLYGGIGHFFTDDVEVVLDTLINVRNSETLYYLKPGVNYYFMKTPTLTPYVGTNVYYFDSTEDNSDSSYGNNYHIGGHQFFSENASITAEIGMDYFEFTEYMQSYSNIYLTYFF